MMEFRGYRIHSTTCKTMENIIKAKKVIQNNQEFLLGVFSIDKIQTFTKYTENNCWLH
jgi:hypothetical protein